MSEMTTIKVSMKTRDALKDLGKKGDSYDTLIRRLMKEKKIAEKYIYRPVDWEKYQKEKMEAEE